MTITILRTCIIYVFIVLAVKIMGKRQIGQLKPHELIITFLVSQIASQPLQDNSIPLASSILPILILVSFEIIVSIVSMKSIKFRDFIQGKPIFVMRNGKIEEKELKRVRMTLDDLVDAVRQNDAFDISEVNDAVIETNGSVSVLKKTKKSPPTAENLKLTVENGGTPIVIVLDGKPITEYFSQTKTPKEKIETIVGALEVKMCDIQLLTIDNNGKLNLIKKQEDV